jgi:hypothetical protein
MIHVYSEFYPFYLGEHSNRVNRLMHLLGTSAAVLSTSRVLLSLVPYLLAGLDVRSSKEINALKLTLGEAGRVVLRGIGIGYACAWVGHFFVEKNRPATFKVSRKYDSRSFKDWLSFDAETNI